jgi:hypothetical protein
MAHEPGWLAAAEEFTITPEPGLPMAGYGTRTEPSLGVHDDLKGRILLLSAGGKRHAFIVLDVLWITPAFYEMVHTRLSGLLDGHEWSLIATHTHGGPEFDQRTRDWMERTADEIVYRLGAALKARRPARLAFGAQAVEGIASNRRPETEVTDPQLSVLRVDDTEGRVRALLYNFTCHPVVLGPDNRHYTADYPGYIARMLKTVYGSDIVTIFTCGAAGDVNTGHTAEASAIGEFIPDRTFARAEQIGRRLAGAVVQLSDSVLELQPAHLQSVAEAVALRFRRFPKEAELRAEIQGLDHRLSERSLSYERQTELKIRRMYRQVMLAKYLESQAFPNGYRQTMIQLVTIGHLKLSLIPGELFVELGLRLKRSHRRGGIVIGYANDYVGYLPTRRAWRAGRYEAFACPYVEGASEQIVTMLQRLHEGHTTAWKGNL